MKATSTLCGKELTELDPDVMDAIGELTNIVIGYAKKYLTDFTMNISLPTVIKGDRLKVGSLSLSCFIVSILSA